MTELKTELKKLYADASKHSVYQSIPDFVSDELEYTETIDKGWRDDHPRLAYLLHMRVPAPGECWLDFGANTGFFTLSLARRFPRSHFIAVEANPNHARFIAQVSDYFGMTNVKVIQQAVGLDDLATLPRTNFLLHLNVLHHAGHDFDVKLVPNKSCFAGYAQRYLELLRDRTDGMLFQMGSNWGGDKRQPLVGARADAEKLGLFLGWLTAADWRVAATAYASRNEKQIAYRDLPEAARLLNQVESATTDPVLGKAFDRIDLDCFPGEFYRRPLFFCH